MIQAILFYLPRCAWLAMEGGLMNFLAKGHTDRIVEDHQEKQKALLEHYHEHVHNKFSKYALGFFFCELLNSIISVSQIFVTNMFLNYQFLDYGTKVYEYYRLPAEERSLPTTLNPMCEVFPKVAVCHYQRSLPTTLNPMCEVFPKVAVCHYQRYGRAGGPESKSAICVLSLNIINDKVFALIWFWHAILVIVGILRLITRVVQLSSSSIRFLLIKMQMHHYLSKNKHAKHIQHYVVNCSIGDWFVLYQMSKNMNKRFFAEFLALISIKINPDPDLSDDPEINILKPEDVLDNGGVDDYFDEEELEHNQMKLKKKVAWRRRVNIFTGKRHLGKKKR